jgi:hypothetical protein
MRRIRPRVASPARRGATASGLRIRQRGNICNLYAPRGGVKRGGGGGGRPSAFSCQQSAVSDQLRGQGQAAAGDGGHIDQGGAESSDLLRTGPVATGGYDRADIARTENRRLRLRAAILKVLRICVICGKNLSRAPAGVRSTADVQDGDGGQSLRPVARGYERTSHPRGVRREEEDTFRGVQTRTRGSGRNRVASRGRAPLVQPGSMAISAGSERSRSACSARASSCFAPRSR